MDDSDILELFFARSERAVAELDAKYGRLFHALAGNILADERDAAECVNDAYLGAWNAIPPERPERLAAYICRIVRNLSVRRLRHEHAAKRAGNYALALEELSECLAANETVESELDARELTRSLERFLDTLSDENRAIFLRRYWFADSCADIARRTGLTEKNVGVRLTRLRKQLRKFLEDMEVYV